ncbi:hypothetical protein BV25DRAFT_1824910 [Artomyces pyxidatus]|uniref:Uncharacterized protein n=1 Tax=Artomyces pyxidatus TaxID=48021 RepID=A0ACB8T2Z7_9AGAM|nr:hypothetical protein BV25DRAFT_1824910 [Artomyces pyxidatus]
MRYTTALSLLLGLGARIAYNKFFSLRDAPGIEDHALSGLWQGVALYYFLMELPYLAFGVGFGIAARLVVNFFLTYDAMACACTMLAVAVAVLFTDLLSQVLEDSAEDELLQRARYEGSTVEEYPRSRRLVQLRRSSSDERERNHLRRRRREFLESTPSVTTATTNTTQSWDSISDWIDPGHTMSPLEREVAALRKKASMADSERRRFKEEKQWAQSQGNKARATQMGWQVKRYSALMQSFHREADLRLLESSNQRHRQEMASIQSAMSQVGGPALKALNAQKSAPAVAVTVSAPSPSPHPIPPPATRAVRSAGPPVRPTAAIPDTRSARPRRSSISKGKERAPPLPADKQLPAGSSHTGTHHRKTTSILSKPSVRIEVHELPSRSRSKRQ